MTEANTIHVQWEGNPLMDIPLAIASAHVHEACALAGLAEIDIWIGFGHPQILGADTLASTQALDYATYAIGFSTLAALTGIPDTARHEVAHIAHLEEWNGQESSMWEPMTGKNSKHGSEWQKWARRVGAVPRACRNDDRDLTNWYDHWCRSQEIGR